MTKDETLALAQREATKAGKPMLVLNLNPYGSLWVVRDYDPQLAKERGVWIKWPEQ